MTDHLRPDVFVDALDGRAEAQTREHLAACAECRAQLDELGAVLREAADVDAPVPSPLFWDHFSERVRVATSTLPTREPWWQAWWRPAAVFGAAAAAVALVFVLQPRTPSPLGPTESVATPAASTVMTDAADDATWGLVVGLASSMKHVDVKEAAEPVAGTADALIDELTPAQRAALARLLEKEIGEQ